MSLYERYSRIDGKPIPPNMNCCREGVWNGYTSVQCPNKVKVTRDGIGYCGVHDPVRLKAKRDAKDAERMARYRVRQQNEEAAQRERQKRTNALKAIELIAEGYNDPRSLARSVLDGSFEGKDVGASEQV